MTDPTPTGAVLASVATSAGLASLGLDPAPMFWALVGASIGMTFASATTRGRAVVVFGAVVLACSLFGKWLALRYYEGEVISRNAFSCALAIAFHPILNAAIKRIPVAIDGILTRLGINGKGDPP
jgi:hypothetical protein